MGWREVLALHAECETLRSDDENVAAKLGARVLAMTDDLKIALARELLAGTGRVVAIKQMRVLSEDRDGIKTVIIALAEDTP